MDATAGRDTPAKPVAAAAETSTSAAQPSPSQLTMPPMTRDHFFQWMGEFENLKEARLPQPVTYAVVPQRRQICTVSITLRRRPSWWGIMSSTAPDDDVEEYTEAPPMIYTNADAVLRKI
ncbi:hypothetical protein EOD39_6777 [Acipenser ruthenus]|uniref:Uncharacterized protein n=1 Tax=Acipenser ruthenus TaxID=7906 RepID=A0A444U923_ACIRT|nr:hypothetical protein EOD39_6776 [Acipenser ruthenus]RXM31662.1 hypothetical protein EOD39_6777 [Acipenser ruthenus]